MPQNDIKKTVAAIVVTYNRLELLRQCVKALQNQTAACDILIVDNASTDGTSQWLASQPELLSRNTGSNLGGAGGFHYGMRWAVESGYDYVWLMDDDTLPKTDALEKLLEADSVLQGNYGWLSSVALWTDGNECKMNRQKRKKVFYEKDQLSKYGLVRAVQATFVSLLLRSETIHRFGLPIKEFFLWGDDIEFTRRIAVRGKQPGYIAQDSRVIHAMTDNNGSNLATDSASRIDRYHYAFRNENCLYRKEGATGFCYYTAKCIFNLAKIIVLSKGQKKERIWIIIKQYFAGIGFNPPIEYLDTQIWDVFPMEHEKS